MAIKLVRFMSGWIPTLVSFFIVIAYLTAATWPTSWWLTVNSTTVFDAEVNQPIIMRVDRSINSGFTANWAVVVRSVSDSGVTVHCTAKGASNYRLDATLPDPLTLDWWASAECARLPVGRYIVSTIWDIDFIFGFRKQVVSESNPFYVLPKMDGIMSPLSPMKMRSIGKQSQWRTGAILLVRRVMRAKHAAISTTKPTVEAAAN